MKKFLISPVFSLIYIAVIFFAGGLLPGCSLSLGGSPEKKPYVSPREVERNVAKEMKSEEIRMLIKDSAKTQKLEELLKTPGADVVLSEEVVKSFESLEVNIKLQEEIKKALETSETKKVFQEQIKKAMETPEFQEALSAAVQKSMMQIVQGGGGQGGGGAQGQGGSSGGGTSGGGGSAGGS